MRESVSRGFWVSSYALSATTESWCRDGAKKRPSLQPNPDASHIVKRIFDMAEAGNGMTGITRTLNDEGIASPRGSCGQDQCPCHPHQRGLHGDSGLGRERKGQRRAGAGGEGVPRHHHKGPVQPSRQADARPCSQEVPSPKGRKHLPAQRSGQVQGVRQGALRPGRQERPVLLLRLPVDHEARQERLRYPQAQRPPPSSR